MPLFLVSLLLSVLLIPLWLPIVVAIQARSARRFRRKMQSLGRFLSWRDLEPELRDGRGTLIIEQANKRGARVWWTPEDVIETSPFAVPRETELDYFGLRVDPDSFVDWCRRRYLDETRGSAWLTEPAVPMPPGLGLAGFFRELYPRLSAIDTVLP